MLSDMENRHLPPPSSRFPPCSPFFPRPFPLLPYFSPAHDTQEIDKPSINIMTTLYQFCQCKGGPIVAAEMSACCISLGWSSILIGRVRHWFIHYWDEIALVFITQTWCPARQKLGGRGHERVRVFGGLCIFNLAYRSTVGVNVELCVCAWVHSGDEHFF